MHVLLASGSPRRRELMAAMDLDFEVVKIVDVPETVPDGITAEQVPAWLSRLKASAYTHILTPDQILVTADTVVVLDGQILGKPTDEADAAEMLRRLSGRTHLVITGVTLSALGRTTTFTDTTEVEFAEIPDREIDSYIRRYMPLDKAGAYGIQEWIGMTYVRRINGCFYNVMGLPTTRLYSELKAFMCD